MRYLNVEFICTCIDIRGWLARKKVLERFKQAKLEQKKLTDFCVKLSFHCENIHEAIARSSNTLQSFKMYA